MFSIYISKADKSVEIDFDSMPEGIKLLVIDYGLTQKLNDKIASFKWDDYLAEGKPKSTFTQDCFDTVLDLLDDLKAGIWKRGGGGKAADARLIEARNILKANFGLNTQQLKVHGADWGAVADFARSVAEGILKASGQKYVKHNVDYGAEKVLDKINEKVDELIATRNDGLDFDINEWK